MDDPVVLPRTRLTKVGVPVLLALAVGLVGFAIWLVYDQVATYYTLTARTERFFTDFRPENAGRIMQEDAHFQLVSTVTTEQLAAMAARVRERLGAFKSLESTGGVRFRVSTSPVDEMSLELTLHYERGTVPGWIRFVSLDDEWKVAGFGIELASSARAQ